MAQEPNKSVEADHNIILSKIKPIWKLGITSGSLQVLVGLAVFFPVVVPESLQILVGIMILVMAVVAGALTWLLRQVVNPTYGILMTLIRLVTAGMLLFHPLDTNITFTTLVAIYFGLDGALGVGEAQKVRLVKPLYAVFMIVSIASIVLSLSIWLYMKGASYVTIATLLALTFWLRGGAAIYLSLCAKKAKQPEEPVTEQPTVQPA